MKTEDLKQRGLDQEQIDFVMKANGKDLAKLQEQIKTSEEQIASLEKKLTTASETLKGFEDMDVEGLKAKLEEYKTTIAEMEETARVEKEQRAYDKALKEMLSEYEFSSEGAKRDVIRQLRESDMKLKDGKLIGFDDVMKGIKEADEKAFVDKAQKEAEAGRAKLKDATGKMTGGAKKQRISMSKLMEMKNANPDLNIDAFMEE